MKMLVFGGTEASCNILKSRLADTIAELVTAPILNKIVMDCILLDSVVTFQLLFAPMLNSPDGIVKCKHVAVPVLANVKTLVAKKAMSHS
jgi:hypothetical protein